MKSEQFALKSADESNLLGLLSKGSLKAKMFKRATALLEVHRGKTYSEVAATLSVCYQSVSHWCEAYKKEGLQMLQDKPRSGRPVEIDGTQRARITALACSDTPDGHSKWSLRLLADKVVELGYCEHVSHNHVGKILKKMTSSRTSNAAGASRKCINPLKIGQFL
ncbi:helix-turn-helix domain-containing protein [Paraflavisolibacter sp. H34]|uniref:helix-turn-helix domain-containing protein n=1 Tax=Huijunlia imazamoxiresistens TaxID=3127457 RepID=UPI0030172F49